MTVLKCRRRFAAAAVVRGFWVMSNQCALSCSSWLPRSVQIFTTEHQLSVGVEFWTSLNPLIALWRLLVTCNAFELKLYFNHLYTIVLKPVKKTKIFYIVTNTSYLDYENIWTIIDSISILTTKTKNKYQNFKIQELVFSTR